MSTFPKVWARARLKTTSLAFALAATLASSGSQVAFAQGAPDDDDSDEGPLPPKKPSAPFLERKMLTVPGKLPGPTPKLPAKIFDKDAAAKVPPPPQPAKLPEKPANGAAANVKDEVTPSASSLEKAGVKRCKPMLPNEKILFDFKGDIRELVATISKTTCKNFILTNNVRSQNFEIVSPTPITVDEAWRAFLSALEANDLTLFQSGRYYKIIQAAEGVRAPVPIYDAGSKHPAYDRILTKIWKVRYGGDATAIVNYLNIFKSQKGHIHPFPNTGTIIATDFGTSLDRLERILAEIDQPGAVEQLHIVPVQYAAATEVAEKLNQIFEPAKAGAKKVAAAKAARVKESAESAAKAELPEGDEDEGPVNVSKILADERTNKLIVIASDRALRQILALMRELDVPGDIEGQIRVVRLKHADAEEMATTLASLAQGHPTSAKKKGSSKAAGGANPPPAPAGGATAVLQGDVKVTADKGTNSLLITAGKGDFESLRQVIERLDVPRLQVFVEAVIMEISTTRNRDLGVSVHGGFPVTIDGEQSPVLFGTHLGNLSSLLTSMEPTSAASLLGFAGVARGPAIDGTEKIVSGGIPMLGVLISALQSLNNVNVVSTPQLLTMDNEEAQIQVSQKVPFSSGLSLGNISGLASSLAGGAGSSGIPNLSGLGLGSVNIQREDVGLTLKIKPQINDDEYVKLEIDQELSDVANIDAETKQPITSKRAAKTSVVVRSQDSVVIGGLVRDKESVSEGKVPLLGDLPLLGWLFKQQKKSVEKVNLVLVLTPYIIRGPDDFRTIFERKMKEHEDFANQFSGVMKDVSASIDWNRKLGPVASYRKSMKKTLDKAENDGPGEKDETIIRGDEPATDAEPKAKTLEGGVHIEKEDSIEDTPPPSRAPDDGTPPVEP